MAADRGLEPGPRPSGWANTAVSEISSWAMEKAQSKPARRSCVVSGLGYDRHHPAQQVPHVPGAEATADAVRSGGMVDSSQPVVERFEADPGPGEIRHSNFIERTFGESRRRVKVIGRC